MPDDSFEQQVAGVAVLDDPVRRAIYQYVAARDAPATREEVASGTGVATHIARFHLDRLEQAGLLDTDYRRPPGRGGPGAGRPAKIYVRSRRQLAVSIPDRRYEAVGRLLAEAITRAGGRQAPIHDVIGEVAEDAGRQLGTMLVSAAANAPLRRRAATAELQRQGYEPRADARGVVLANCPFHDLAADYPDLVCGLNLALLRGLLLGAGATEFEASLDPAPGGCCVRLHRR